MLYNPLITVIIPYYNRAQTLSYCIDSVLNATYKNVEILLIDDGSNDNSATIGYNYALKYHNIEYYSQRNSGVSSARNKGLEKAKGEWVTFIDSDDVVLPHFFDIVVKEGEMADLLMTAAISASIGNITDSYKETGTRIEHNCAKDYLMSNEFNPFKNIFYTVWCKFFKTNLIRGGEISFDESMSLGEDQSFVCDYLCFAKTLVRYTSPSYVCVKWDSKIEHLGGKLRSPENFLHNQIRAYNSLIKLSKLIDDIKVVNAYAVNFGIDRPITRILYGYAKNENARLIGKKEFYSFVNQKLIPFISSVDTSRYDAKNFDVRFSKFLLLRYGAVVGYKWAKIWINYLSPVSKAISGILVRPYYFLKYRIGLLVSTLSKSYKVTIV